MKDDDDDKKAPTELTMRQVFDILVRDRAARAYTFATLGALAMVFLVLFMNGSDVGGVLVVMFGVAALVLRWTAAPPFLLLLVAYFQLFPFGIPDPGSENPYEVRESQFRVTDMLLIMATLVYLRSQYRVFGLVHQIVPFESAVKRKGDAPTRRPSGHIRPDEIAWMVGLAGGIVLVGQGLWWLVNALEFVPLTDGFPFQWADTKARPSFGRATAVGEYRPGQNRFFVLIGGLFFGVLILRLVFGYWQLRMMNASEGAMVLTDTSWAESHRERVRVEKWRIWGRKRVEKQAEDAEREERERQLKAERKRLREERERAERAEDERRRQTKRKRPKDRR